MSLDLNRKTVIKNAFRISKRRNYTAIRIRVPGGHLKANHMAAIAAIAEKFGDGTLHITIRQGFEIPNIPFERMAEVNAALTAIIETLEIKNGVTIENIGAGYPSAGMRNISACIGNRVCPFANVDTTSVAQRLEAAVFPNDFHMKIAVTGCPNDCIKAHMQDFGVVGICEPEYDYDECIGCEACVKNCERKVTGALQMKNGKVIRDERRCIGCGECVLSCPTSAWTRRPGKLFRLLIMGRTGKKNPRLAMPFLDRVTEEVVTAVIRNTLAYVDRYILRCLPKEHIGYIVDRTGYAVFKNEVLEGVALNPEALVAKTIQWPGYNTLNDANFKKDQIDYESEGLEMYSETLAKLSALAVAKRDMLNGSRLRYFVLSMLAGFYVGLGIILILTIGGLMGADPLRKILMGTSFGIALSLVIMAGSELFTGNNMIMTAASLNGKVSWEDSGRIWLWSWFGNWAGSILVSVLFVLSGLAAGATGTFTAGVSAAKMSAPVLNLFFQGFLCNILVCLAVLCGLKLKEETAKLIMIWWCLFAFITSGFEHSIANMTVLTIGLFSATGAEVNLAGYFYNLGVVGLGNLLGGALILGGGYWLAGRE